MGRRRIEDHYVRNLQKTAGGATYIISLPIDLVRQLGWQARQKLEVKKHGYGLIITDWQE